MDDDIIIGDIITSINGASKNVMDALKLMQRLTDIDANSDVFNALIGVQREISDIKDYFKSRE